MTDRIPTGIYRYDGEFHNGNPEKLFFERMTHVPTDSLFDNVGNAFFDELRRELDHEIGANSNDWARIEQIEIDVSGQNFFVSIYYHMYKKGKRKYEYYGMRHFITKSFLRPASIHLYREDGSNWKRTYKFQSTKNGFMIGKLKFTKK
jgi:hypothetical protein